jgi:hypothetical protein
MDRNFGQHPSRLTNVEAERIANFIKMLAVDQ